MFVPVQYTSRRRRLAQSLESAILLALVFGLAGVGVNLPPLPPPGVNPSDGDGSKKCPECGNAVQPGPDGHCVCPNCDEEFEAADADDYS
jgi:hypothetical protein